MIQINIDDEIINLEEVDKETINKILEMALEEENIINKEVVISIYSATREEIRNLNREYRNVDRETDVLSFPIFTKEEILNTKFNHIELGDIVICLDVVRNQSAEYGTGMKRELLYMITHGICHLLGYDHEIEEDKKIMREKEERILNMIGVSK